MTSPHPINGRADPDAAPERLSSAWDELVTGRHVETDEGLVALAQRLHATTTTTRERPGFRQDLRDTLLQSPTIAMPIPGDLSGHRIDQAAAGGYFASVGLPGGDGRATSVAGFQDATPIAEVDYSGFKCSEATGFNPYLPCPLAQQTLGTTELSGAYSGLAGLVRSVQMQGWRVEAGKSVSFSTPTSDIVGVGLDLILNGAYAGTFSTPITIGEGGGTNRDHRTRTVPAGEPVELVAGDIVTYEIGTRLQVENPLAAAPLIFKSILFHEGDPSPANFGPTGDSGAFTVTVDGDGSLPYAIGEYRQWPGVLVSYVTVADAFPFPPMDNPYQLVLGPVGGPADAERLEGYVVWTTDAIG